MSHSGNKGTRNCGFEFCKLARVRQCLFVANPRERIRARARQVAKMPSAEAILVSGAREARCHSTCFGLFVSCMS